ncbi:MAG: cobalt-precorrin-5B (C(1))-methyltransferase CbiD [Spirochaetales bacterium]|nr:cobalt-precorrin-5B (C(1))-methyltransferase CbiD [Spirochaetales bacterium]
MPEETARLLGKVQGMQRGYTTGTTAQGACKGAAELLLSGQRKDRVRVTLPGGLEIPLALEDCSLQEGSARCAVRKDPGDDIDSTRGLSVYARVSLTDQPGVVLEGGTGVGRVTREGLAVPPGRPAINPMPEKMIRRELEALCPPGRGFSVLIEIPQGEEVARKTWNPRLGIEGGLSIIGTTGIVEPKSEEAYKATIDVYVNMAHTFNGDFLCITLGYVGEKALAGETCPIPLESVVKCGDHVGHTLEYARSKGFEKIYLIGHVGKLVKLALGIFNTHWKSGDGRLELLALLAGLRGADRDLMERISRLSLAEEAVTLLEESGFGGVFDDVVARILDQVEKRWPGMNLDVALVDLQGRFLARGETHGE